MNANSQPGYQPPDDVVEFIAGYMNETHPQALVEIARADGLDADAVEIVAMTSTDLLLRVRVGDSAWRPAAIAWPTPLGSRPDIRLNLERMETAARYLGWQRADSQPTSPAHPACA